MRPTKSGQRLPDQDFDGDEKLFRRVPAECVGPENELEPSCVQVSFGKTLKSAPSVIRERYGTMRDALHLLCAGEKDVSRFIVFYLKVRDLPKGCLSGTGEKFDFYPNHDPLETCYAHSVIACQKADSPIGSYREPTRPVKNEFKAKFIAALARAEAPTLSESLILDAKKYWAAMQSPRA